MEKVFDIDYTIGYFEVDNDLLLTPSGLAVYLQDTAILNSDSIGYTMEYFNEEKKGWVIINWHIDISRMPKKGETIKICTWCDECKKMFAERSFIVYDSNEIPIVRAISKWVYMDLEKRRPVKISEDMAKKYNSLNIKAIENEDYKIQDISDYDFISEKVFNVRRRDTDTNGHTNNTKYIEWAVDNVPDDIYYNKNICDIRVVYRKESYKNSSIKSKCYIKEFENDKKCVTSIFYDAEDEKTIFAEVSTAWL